ncbi:MAG: 1-deoxy-D-xylulose-5-phosphate synthase [Desulfovibrio sp.]
MTTKYKILSTIKQPGDVAGLSIEDQELLASELRREIIETVSSGGGHLAPSLGVIELTVALFNNYNLKTDRLVWDVGHQAYAHKLLTGRLPDFRTLRKMGGISGFPRREENKYDHFGVGHSSTSISAALGMAMARDLDGGKDNVVAVIGDGSMTAGLAFEGLNQAGDMGRKFTVVLNDNEMSISQNVGALSSFLSRKLSAPLLTRFKKEFETRLRQIPKIGDDLALYAKRGEDSFKSFFTPGMLFEALRFTYVGPIDGHNLELLNEVFNQVKQIDQPALVHVITRKGKGYEPAETNPRMFHGVGSFIPETGLAKKPKTGSFLSYTEVFGESLCKIGAKNKKVVAITAAMPDGTGTDCFRKKFPERFVDVGICEQHAVTFAAGLACEGYLPAVSIYSTFMQRSYDQIVHDVCLQNLNVKLFLDRCGLVGEDGATHHGAFDISFLRHIPNIVVMAPKDEAELSRMISTAFATEGPVAVRYPRGTGVGAIIPDEPELLEIGKGELLKEGSEVIILAFGSRVYPSLEAAQEFNGEVGVFNMRFVKPLPEEQLREIAKKYKKIVTVEENALAGGMGSAVIEFLTDEGLMDGLTIRRLGLKDEFIEHGTQQELRRMVGIDKCGIMSTVQKML